MIVLDEQLADPRIIQDSGRWYKGKVISIVEVRRGPLCVTKSS